MAGGPGSRVGRLGVLARGWHLGHVGAALGAVLAAAGRADASFSSLLACRRRPTAGGSAELVQNQLLKHTAVEARFSCNMVALVGSQPRSLTLKDFLQHFLDFRRACGLVGSAWHGCPLCACVQPTQHVCRPAP